MLINVLKNLIFSCRGLIDIFLSILIFPAAFIMYFYRRVGAQRLPRTSTSLRKVGVFPIRNHYYEPLFDPSALRFPLSNERELPGINLNVGRQLSMLNNFIYGDELKGLDLWNKRCEAEEFSMINDSFGPGDADILYQMVRFLKPRKIVEIGSGNSTKIANLAIRKNLATAGVGCEHICIEPYEQKWLEKMAGIKLIREKVETFEFDWANELRAGDLLFIDSSHVIRPQGDVLVEYLNIIPKLSVGVYIHIHDIFTPRDYLEDWVVSEVRFWNEQYILEALISNTNRYEVVLALNMLNHSFNKNLKSVSPYLMNDSQPGSFYIKVCN